LYVANGSVVVPTFDQGTDEIAVETVRRVFPDRVVIPFPSRELLLGGGAVHCVTRDIPAIRQ
jgi:agmatine deiminase